MCNNSSFCSLLTVSQTVSNTQVHEIPRMCKGNTRNTPVWARGAKRQLNSDCWNHLYFHSTHWLKPLPDDGWEALAPWENPHNMLQKIPQRDISAINSDRWNRFYVHFIHWLKPWPDDGQEALAPWVNPQNMLQKMPHTEGWKCKPWMGLEPTLQQWWQAINFRQSPNKP